MKIRIIADTFIRGELVKASDEAFDVDDRTARELITACKAETVVEAAVEGEEKGRPEPASKKTKERKKGREVNKQ